MATAAQPVGNCQRRWGMFGAGDRSNCGEFVNCVDGTEFRFTCPEGLAWDAATWRCEWADKVESCDVEGNCSSTNFPFFFVQWFMQMMELEVEFWVASFEFK